VNTGVIVLACGVLFSLALLGLALGGAGEQVKGQLRRRAQALHKRAGGALNNAEKAAQQQKTSVRLQQGKSLPFIDNIVKRYLPRQAMLRDRLSRTGYEITVGNYLLGCLGLGVVGFGATWLIFHFPPVLAAAVGVIIGVGLPHFATYFLALRRQKRFIDVLPDAVDLIVRGLRSGLPVTESINAVGREMPDPLGEEFRRVADGVRFGQSLEEVLWESARRLSIPEFNFFVISLSVQRETGGNLGETLANLSDILRRRRQMHLKIKAMSSEARASALILGSLPFVMFAIVRLLNPGYAMQLFDDPRGMMMVGVGLLSIVIGAAIMKKMVSFEI